MSVRDNFIGIWGVVIAVSVALLVSTNSDAAMLVPTSISGAISYSYGYTRAGGGGESETQAITGSISGSGYYWQPWFISLSATLTGSFSRSDSSTSSSSSNSHAWGGSLGVNVFPVSRFPFSLTVSHTNSLLENNLEFSGSANRTFTSTRLLAQQRYLAESGYNSNLTWSHGRFDSEGSTSTSDVISADTRKTFTNSSLLATANYSTSSDSKSAIKPQNWGVQLSHNYVPGNQLGVSNFVSTSGSKTDFSNSKSQTQSVQGSSAFSWRPEYKPYSFSGGARIAYNENTQNTNGNESKSTSNVASLSMGLNYRLSRKVALFLTGGASGGSTASGGIETTSRSANASLGTSYSSDQYSILGFQYGWNVGAGAGGSTSNTQTTGGDSSSSDENSSETTSNVGLNAGHSASRNWSLGRATSLGLSISQSVGGSTNDKNRGSFSVGTGVGLSGTTRGNSGSTFGGISLSHSYSESDSDSPQGGGATKTKTEAFFGSINFSRNQTLNRLSALTANAGLQWSQSSQSNQIVTTTSTANASLNYRHMRAFGIYALRFDSNATYSATLITNSDQLVTVSWYNSFQYNVGLLDMALDIDFDKASNSSQASGSLRFRATRTF